MSLWAITKKQTESCSAIVMEVAEISPKYAFFSLKNNPQLDEN
jgi:hypothetical protein